MQTYIHRRIRIEPIGTGQYWAVLERCAIVTQAVGLMELEPGFVFDGHSIPAPFRPLLHVWQQPEAAGLHDLAYRIHAARTIAAGKRIGLRPRAAGDAAYLELLLHRQDAPLVLPAPSWRARVQYAGVRVGGGGAYAKRPVNWRPPDIGSEVRTALAETIPTENTDMATDRLGRPLIGPAIAQQIETALSSLPEFKRGALVVVADEHGTRAHLAARLGSHWKVAAGGGLDWTEKKPRGYVAAELAW